MTAQRPTTLQLFLDHCPKAVDLYEAGALYGFTRRQVTAP